MRRPARAGQMSPRCEIERTLQGLYRTGVRTHTDTKPELGFLQQNHGVRNSRVIGAQALGSFCLESDTVEWNPKQLCHALSNGCGMRGNLGSDHNQGRVDIDDVVAL